MGAPVEVSDLAPHLDHYGTRATVITVSADGRPHVGTSVVTVSEDLLRLTVGQRAAANLAGNANLCLTWTPPDGEAYQLIVDATVHTITPAGDGFNVAATVGNGIRHRVADAPDTGASCVRLSEIG